MVRVVVGACVLPTSKALFSGAQMVHQGPGPDGFLFKAIAGASPSLDTIGEQLALLPPTLVTES